MLRDSKALYVANFGCSKTFFCCLREMLYEEKKCDYKNVLVLLFPGHIGLCLALAEVKQCHSGRVGNGTGRPLLSY